MSPKGKYLTPGETQRLQHDLKQMLNRCDAMFMGVAKQERAKTDRLRSAFLMMRDMGYTADEAKDEFTRFQAEYNAGRNHSQCQQPLRQHVKRSYSRPTNKRRMSGVERYKRAFSLTVVIIPILFFVGLVTEIWFYYNPWGRALTYVIYGKAAAYLITWYVLLSACMPKVVSKVLMAFFTFAAIGVPLSCETLIDAWGISMWAGAWVPFWVKLKWWYWGLLAITYLWAWWKLAHGPRYWILKYGVGEQI